MSDHHSPQASIDALTGRWMHDGFLLGSKEAAHDLEHLLDAHEACQYLLDEDQQELAALRAEVERLKARQERTQGWLDRFQGTTAQESIEAMRQRQRADRAEARCERLRASAQPLAHIADVFGHLDDHQATIQHVWERITVADVRALAAALSDTEGTQ